jgi:hypothetical protein
MLLMQRVQLEKEQGGEGMGMAAEKGQHAGNRNFGDKFRSELGRKEENWRGIFGEARVWEERRRNGCFK